MYNSKITTEEADEVQSHLLVEILEFKKKAKPKRPQKKQQKDDVLKNLYKLFEGRETVLNVFDSKIVLNTFDSIILLEKFFHHINNLHQNIKFIMEEESNGELAFLDTLLKQNNGEISYWYIGSLHILTNTSTAALTTNRVTRKVIRMSVNLLYIEGTS